MSEEDLLAEEHPIEQVPPQQSRWDGMWESISRAGLADIAIRLGTHVFLVALILVVAWVMREFYLNAQS
jgi:hypothetical protein